MSGVVPADDIRGQTVIYDLGQFEADVREAARQIGKAVPPMRAFDAGRQPIMSLHGSTPYVPGCFRRPAHNKSLAAPAPEKAGEGSL